MPHQGNTYLGYNLVLLVQPPPPLGRAKAERLATDVTVRAIRAHVRLHLFCRFCKDQTRMPQSLDTLVSHRVKIRPVTQETVKQVPVDRLQPCIHVLVDTGVYGQVGTNSLCDFAEVQENLRRSDPAVHVELFRIHKPGKRVADWCEAVLDANNIHDPQSRHDENLYHVASRVCSSLVEYQASWTMGKNHRNHFYGKGDVKPLDILSFDRNPSATPPRISEALVLKKIIDIRDAIDLVCGCLDGAMHYFPPVPDDLQHIFAGKDTGSSVWARYKFPFGVWFRGSPRLCYDLQPSLFRYNTPRGIHRGCTKRQNDQVAHFDECSMVHHFREHLPGFKREYGAMFDWLSLMQHHQAPTRLLDWTENILFALYFAVRDRHADCDAAIWVLNAGRLNEITRVSTTRRYVCFPSSMDVHLRTAMAVSHTWGETRRTLLKLGLLNEVLDALRPDDKKTFEWLTSDPSPADMQAREPKLLQELRNKPRRLKFREKLAYPVAVYPSRVNERLADQLGTFTLHGGKAYDPVLRSNFSSGGFDKSQSLASLNLEVLGNRIEGKQFLDVFVVPSGAKRKIREQLKRVGVHAATVFPELDYQSEYMKREWMIPKRIEKPAPREDV